MQQLGTVSIVVISSVVGAGLGAFVTLGVSRRRHRPKAGKNSPDDGHERQRQRAADEDRLRAIRNERIRLYARMSEHLQDQGTRLSKAASTAMVGEAMVDDAGPVVSAPETSRVWKSMILLASDRTIGAWDDLHRAGQDLCSTIRELSGVRSEAKATPERMIPAMARLQSSLDHYGEAQRKMAASMSEDLDLQESGQPRRRPYTVAASQAVTGTELPDDERSGV